MRYRYFIFIFPCFPLKVICYICVMCVCVCVRERKREREKIIIIIILRGGGRSGH